jgi:Ca2+-binding EF-hand superfamily protein
MRMVLLFAAMVAAVPAAAQQQQAAPVPARPAQPTPVLTAEPVALMIAAFDRDGDARVTREEFAAGLRQSFDSIDTRRTGSLGFIAFSDWAERWLGDRNTLPSPFETDRDDDGKITYAELAARFDQFFTRFDLNKDGVLVRSELLTFRPPVPSPDKRRRRNRDNMNRR